MTQDDRDEVELMARYGITRTSVYRYQYKMWSYSNIGDAIAQARREDERQAKR